MLLRAKRPAETGRVAQALWPEPTDFWRAEQTFFSLSFMYLILLYIIRRHYAQWTCFADVGQRKVRLRKMGRLYGLPFYL